MKLFPCELNKQKFFLTLNDNSQYLHINIFNVIKSTFINYSLCKTLKKEAY